MTLYSIEGKEQEPIGQSEHWELFKRFKETALYPIMVDHIEKHLDQDSIKSNHLGSNILSGLESSHPGVVEEIGTLELGALFGMTLWNVIASSEEEWYFTRSVDKAGDYPSTTYFKKK